MNHLNVELARQLLRGRLDTPTAQRWQQHLRQCTRCRKLLAAERALLTMLDLGQPPASEPRAELESLLDRAGGLGRRGARWRQPAGVIGLSGWLAALFLCGLLVWQLHGVLADGKESGDGLGVAPKLQDEVRVNLRSLTALAEDPWLADYYEAVRTLEELIAERGR